MNGEGKRAGDVVKRRPPADDAALWRRFRGALGEDLKASTVYRMKLSGTHPRTFTYHLKPVLSPNPARGEELMSGVWRIGQGRMDISDGAAPWSAPAPSRHFADRLHRFGWLANMIASGERGTERARALVDHWNVEFSKFNGFAWRLGPTADRIWNLLLCGAVLFEHGDEKVQSVRMDALMRQVRHLEVSLDACADPDARWRGACIMAAISLGLHGGKNLEDAWHRLDAECTAQILADGGHVSRSPERTMDVLTDLLVLKEVCERAGESTPLYFDKWLPRMAVMLKFFTDGDGALDPFNNGGESHPEHVSTVLGVFGGELRRPSFAMKSGYQKLERGGLRLVLDCGAAPDMPFGDQAHAGVLGFKFSDGASRIITSCGFSPDVNVDWQAAVRRTGAHSTLILSGRDNAAFVTNDATRLLAPVGPEGISAKRKEEGDDAWIDAQHSGYKSNYGLLHRRNLFMSGDGSRVVGEDALVRPVSEGDAENPKAINFDIRFHLHPSVTAMTKGDSIHLISDHGPTWRFRTTQPGTRLEPSIYLARGRVERTEQIVMSGRADPNGDGEGPPNCVKWAFLKDG